MKRMKKLLAGLAIALVATGSSVAFANGYQDVTHMDKAAGASVAAKPLVTATYGTSARSEGASNHVTVGSEAVSRQQPIAALKGSKLPLHTTAPVKPITTPAVPIPTEPTVPAANCFVASEEGIYVPVGANTGTITLTADHPVYWQTMSHSITTTDAGTDVAADFPAYIVLESVYDPALPTTSISFHLHARDTAQLGEYCPNSDAGQVGLIAYTKQDHATKLFDVPMNINIVDHL